MGEWQKRKKQKKRIKPITSFIKDVTPGFVTIKGKLKQIQTITSPLTKSPCIGYKYSSFIYKSSGTVSVSNRDKGLTYSKGDKYKKWKTIASDTKCNDFYIEDETGKIKVKANGITIQLLGINQTDEKSSNQSIKSENLLLENDQEFIITGTVKTNKKKELVIKKSDNEFIIYDPHSYTLSQSKLPHLISRYGLIFMLTLIGALAYFIASFLK